MKRRLSIASRRATDGQPARQLQPCPRTKLTTMRPTRCPLSPTSSSRSPVPVDGNADQRSRTFQSRGQDRLGGIAALANGAFAVAGSTGQASERTHGWLLLLDAHKDAATTADHHRAGLRPRRPPELRGRGTPPTIAPCCTVWTVGPASRGPARGWQHRSSATARTCLSSRQSILDAPEAARDQGYLQ